MHNKLYSYKLYEGTGADYVLTYSNGYTLKNEYKWCFEVGNNLEFTGYN